MEMLTKETQQWEQRRNASQKGVDWQFSTRDARIKLKRLYPQIGEHGEAGDYAASGISSTSMAGCTRMAGLLRV